MPLIKSSVYYPALEIISKLIINNYKITYQPN